MRRTALGAVLVAAALVGAGDAVARDPPPAPVRAKDLQKRVDASIAKGVAWLRSAQKKDGGFADEGALWSGGPAFGYLALRVCKVAADDPAAVAAYAAMRRKYLEERPKGEYELDTDTAATYCMALAEHGAPSGARDASGEATYVLNAEDAAWMKEMVKFLEEMQEPRGSFAYCRDQKRDKDSDSGQTQRALLGLKAASRAGVRARTETWAKAMQCFFDVQESSGPAVPRTDGTKGVDHARGYGSPREKRSDLSVFGWNVSDGVASVVICRGELSPDPKKRHSLDAKAEQSIRDGIAWLGKDLDELNPFTASKARRGADHADYVVVYSLERAGDLAGVEKMGAHDWYGEGAEHLLALQDAAGSWGVEHAPKGVRMMPGEVLEATCSALLFLARGTPNGGSGALTRPLDDTDINFSVATSLKDADFEDFLDLVLSRWRKIEDAEVKERLLAKATAVGPRIVAPLVRRLASAKEDERTAALALLRRATGLDLGDEPKWREWLAANEAKLRYDPLVQRVVVGP